MVDTWYQQYLDIVKYHETFGKVCAHDVKQTTCSKGDRKDWRNDDFEISLTFLGDPRIHPLPTMNGFKIKWNVVNIMPGSDAQIWIDHFDRFKVDYSITTVDDEYIQIITDGGHGYSGFYFFAVFDMSGKFLKYGAAE